MKVQILAQMKKTLVVGFVIFFGVGILARSAQAASGEASSEESLEQKMQTLNLQGQDRAPVEVSQEKLYSVQSRISNLNHRSEFSIGGGSDLTGDSFMNSEQLQAAYRFHFNHRWAAGLAYASVLNQLSNSANTLYSVSGVLPDVPYAISRTDLTAEANLFYGKFRLTSDRVFYFDQYVALGPGLVRMNNGTVGAAVGDVGFAVWIGSYASLRLGLKDYYQNEFYSSGVTTAHNLFAHVDMGVLF